MDPSISHVIVYSRVFAEPFLRYMGRYQVCSILRTEFTRLHPSRRLLGMYMLQNCCFQFLMISGTLEDSSNIADIQSLDRQDISISWIGCWLHLLTITDSYSTVWWHLSRPGSDDENYIYSQILYHGPYVLSPTLTRAEMVFEVLTRDHRQSPVYSW